MKINSFYPVLMTDEVKKCADFFIKYFDFKLTFQMDWYISLIDENNIELAFIDYKHESIPSGYRLPNSGLFLNFEVDNVDDVYNRLKQDLGTKIIYDIKSEDFGQRHFILSAAGNILVDVIQVISPSKEYEDNYE